MANNYVPLFRGAAATGSTTLYTVPAKVLSTMITSIVVTNTAGTSATYTLTVNGVLMVPTKTIPANDYIQFEPKQVLTTGQIIAGLASATTVNFHISGLEMA